MNYKERKEMNHIYSWAIPLAVLVVIGLALSFTIAYMSATDMYNKCTKEGVSYSCANRDNWKVCSGENNTEKYDQVCCGEGSKAWADKVGVDDRNPETNGFYKNCGKGADCLQGPKFWCGSEDNFKLCGGSSEQYKQMCDGSEST